MISGQRLGL